MLGLAFDPSSVERSGLTIGIIQSHVWNDRPIQLTMLMNLNGKKHRSEEVVWEEGL
jgi:hypothetical protein